MIPIQTSISGYQGKPATVFSGYDPESRILVVSVESVFRPERQAQCLVIANDETLFPRDVLFTDDCLPDAISAFYALHSGTAADSVSPRLVFDEKAARCNPTSGIERDGLSESGYKYRISDTMSNAQMAVLATCWYARIHFSRVNRYIEKAERFADLLMKNGVITV